jgi:hypothetical protein
MAPLGVESQDVPMVPGVGVCVWDHAWQIELLPPKVVRRAPQADVEKFNYQDKICNIILNFNSKIKHDLFTDWEISIIKEKLNIE